MKVGKVKRIIALILAAGLVITGGFSAGITAEADSCGGLEEADVREPGKREVIRDPILHWSIRSSLNAIKADPPLELDASVVGQVQGISYSLCAHASDFEGWKKQYWIKSLEGLQYAGALQSLEICYSDAGRENEGNRIDDLSPISNLSQLNFLKLVQDGITDIRPIKGLVNLTELDLSGNHEISDISAVRDMKKLTNLSVEGNKITDISAVAELNNLTYLNIAKNQISGLPALNGLQKVYFLDASMNNLTNEDIKKIGAMKGLKELNLQGNAGVTDIRPLARLTSLEKERTLFDDSLAGEKDNLFAAIDVNKLFNKFNISKMRPSDSDNVKKALDAYQMLSDEQKTYFETKRIEAAQANKDRVDSGLPPEPYEEYDEEAEAQPVLDRLLITVVDKNGKPMPNVTFKRVRVGDEKEIVTDSNGMLEIVHGFGTSYLEQAIILSDAALKSKGYKAIPERFEYEERLRKTYAVNGKLVNGLEKHQIMLVLENEYVDKTALKEAIETAKTVGEQYQYTASSYNTYLNALKAAQSAYNNTAAAKGTVDKALTDLKNALKALKKADTLTKLKLIVKDKNGNIFSRAFKFQIYEAGTKKNAWNGLSNAETGIIYLDPGKISAGEWTIDACYEEPYTIDTFNVTIGVRSDGQRYYKAVNKKAIGVDFERIVIVKARPGGASDKKKERKPNSDVLKKRIESVKQYKPDGYTKKSYNNLQTAIKEAETVLAKAGASQEDYNAAVAKLKSAENELGKPANTYALEKALYRYEDRIYAADSYTNDTWNKYRTEYEYAKKVYEDSEATQKQADEALSRLNAAEKALKTNRDALRELFAAAKALKAEDYVGGYDELQLVIAEVQEVYSDIDNADESEVKAAVEKLQKAFNALKKKPAPKPASKPVIKPIKVKRIRITGLSGKIAQGKSVKLKAVVTPSNATNKKVIWKSSNKKVATVNAKGVVTLKKKSGGKKVKITAKAADGSKVVGSYTITSVKNAVKKISISGAKSVKAGKSLKLKAKVTASKGANKKVIWTSSNKKYASVSSAGKVQTYKAGKKKSVKITAMATDGSGKKRTVTIKIK